MWNNKSITNRYDVMSGCVGWFKHYTTKEIIFNQTHNPNQFQNNSLLSFYCFGSFISTFRSFYLAHSFYIWFAHVYKTWLKKKKEKKNENLGQIENGKPIVKYRIKLEWHIIKTTMMKHEPLDEMKLRHWLKNLSIIWTLHTNVHI